MRRNLVRGLTNIRNKLATNLIPTKNITKSLLFKIYQRTYSSSIIKENLNENALSKYKISELNVEQYYKLSEESLSSLLDQLEELIQEKGDDTFDLEYSSGVLTLKLGHLGTYVINKQPPNKQIWLSSPISGPKRYDFDLNNNLWFYSRDGEALDKLLTKELSQLLKAQVKIEL